MNALMITGLLTRFFKWHIFLRACKYRIKIRKSIAVFFSSLFINLLFPFLIGEILAKIYFLKQEGYRDTVKNSAIIITERLLDVIIIMIFRVMFFYSVTNSYLKQTFYFVHNPLDLIGLFVAILASVLILLTINFRAITKALLCLIFGGIGWLIIYLIYFLLPAGVSNHLSFVDFGYYFSNYVLLYHLTPMGMFVAANYQYIILDKFIHEPNLLWITAINMRIVSIFPTFMLGLAALGNLIRQRIKGVAYHFDNISDEYDDMIPEHIRERLIERKCKLIADYFPDGETNSRTLIGLDLGGGKGWYASRIIAITGARVVLVERSMNQARDAVQRDPRIIAVIADMRKLPFKNSSVDFGFSINAFHHLDNETAQLQAFASLSAVLKNKGFFYLHEINLHNIFFKAYMNYFFPLIKSIDEGIECWISPEKNRFASLVSNNIVYFTFIPDFVSSFFMNLLLPLEKRLESSSLNRYSAHYFRVFENIKH